jgi:hypothetical protein
MPQCVVVDFPFYEGPPFFAEDARRTWVPILPRTVTDDVQRDVSRTQIPLILAWAITPWKAQGMTLRRAVVNLGKAAQKPGVLFVALSRVRHPDDLMLDDNFPDFRQLMRVRRNEAFKQRQLWEKQRHADFARTIRKHCRESNVFGADLAWTEQEAAVAEQLLRSVRALPSGTLQADWLPAAKTAMPNVGVDTLADVWERLQEFPHNVEVAEARGAIDHMDLADARDAKGRRLLVRTDAVAPTVATAAVRAAQTLPTTQSAATTLREITRGAPQSKRARQPEATHDEPQSRPKRTRYALQSPKASTNDVPGALQQLSVPIAEKETATDTAREEPGLPLEATPATAPASAELQTSADSLLKRRRVTTPMAATTSDASAAPTTFFSGPSLARVQDAVASQHVSEFDTWTLDPAAIPDDLRLAARELLTDEHITFLFQCLLPESPSRYALTPAQATVLLHGLQDGDIQAARDGRLSDALSDPSIAELFVPLNTTLLAGVSADAGSHWVLLHLDRSGSHPPTLWDSLPQVSVGGLEVARTFMRRLRTLNGWERLGNMPLVPMPYGAQHDGFQCGFFVALAARALAHGALPQPRLA